MKITYIDIIILSYAQTSQLKEMTINCIDSLIQSEDASKIQFNIIVVESEKSIKPFQYDHSSTLYPDGDFGYHRFMNLGISRTSSPYICICNNDLIFHRHWATEILSPFLDFDDVVSASPICSIHHPKVGIEINSGLKLGYRIRHEIAGWCIFFKRDLLNTIGMLDPNFNFWCADNDYANTLWALGKNHVLVTSSVVDHLENKTLTAQTINRQLDLTEGESVYFRKKWNPKMGEGWLEIK